MIFDDIVIDEKCSHVKLDIGLSYNAPHSQIWLTHEPHLMVFGFEPNPDANQAILSLDNKKRHPAHGEPLSNKFINEGRFKLYEVALGNTEKEEMMVLYVSKNDCGTSSLFKPQEKNIGPTEKLLNVPVLNLKMFFDKFPWDKVAYIDYIKIDAQGSDLNILKGAGDYLRERVVYVTAEPDGYQYHGANECNVQNIQTYMESQNFVRVQHPYTKDPTFLNKKYEHLKRNIFICQLS